MGPPSAGYRGELSIVGRCKLNLLGKESLCFVCYFEKFLVVCFILSMIKEE